MKKLVLASFAFAVVATPAAAADIPARAIGKAPPPAAVAYNWTGIYTASTLGVGWWHVDGTYTLPPLDGHNSRATRGLYGSHLGAQIQVNQWVFGIEGGYHSPLDRDYATTVSPSGDCLLSVANRTCHSRIRDYWTVGGRLGMAWDRWMIFGAGGFASGRIQTLTTVTTTGVETSSTSNRHGGWYAGAGLEYFLAKFWLSDVILGLEYQHVDLRSERHFDATGLLNANTRDMKARIDVVRARLVFKYGVGPVVAAY